MGKRTRRLETGAVIARYPARDGDDTIVAAISLPGSLWERVTGWVGEMMMDDRDGSALPLDIRIGLFLDLQTQIWASESRLRDASGDPFDSDLDDDVPF